MMDERMVVVGKRAVYLAKSRSGTWYMKSSTDDNEVEISLNTKVLTEESVRDVLGEVEVGVDSVRILEP